MTEFELIKDEKNPRYVDVKYPNEKYPRYMIDLYNETCTCHAGTFGLPCKHIKEYRDPQ